LLDPLPTCFSLLRPALPPTLFPYTTLFRSHLVRDIESRGARLTTGFIGVRHLCPILTEYGHGDLAYRLALSERYPSWGYSIRQGATTIWERWDGWTQERGFQSPKMNSFNHFALGSIGEWLFEYVVGIGDDRSGDAFK